MNTNRRSFIRHAAALTAGASALPALSFADMDEIEEAGKKIETLTPLEAAGDEAFGQCGRVQCVMPDIGDLAGEDGSGRAPVGSGPEAPVRGRAHSRCCRCGNGWRRRGIGRR